MKVLTGTFAPAAVAPGDELESYSAVIKIIRYGQLECTT